MDGYLATKDHNLDWLYDTGTPNETSYDEFYRHMDVVLMGGVRLRRLKRLGIRLRLILPQKNMSLPMGSLLVQGLRQLTVILLSL